MVDIKFNGKELGTIKDLKITYDKEVPKMNSIKLQSNIKTSVNFSGTIRQLEEYFQYLKKRDIFLAQKMTYLTGIETKINDWGVDEK